MSLTHEWVEQDLHECDQAMRDGPEECRQFYENRAELCRHWLATQWQPIATAPIDEFVLVTWPPIKGGVTIGIKRDLTGRRNGWQIIFDTSYTAYVETDPLGWQPLPTPQPNSDPQP